MLIATGILFALVSQVKAPNTTPSAELDLRKINTAIVTNLVGKSRQSDEHRSLLTCLGRELDGSIPYSSAVRGVKLLRFAQPVDIAGTKLFVGVYGPSFVQFKNHECKTVIVFDGKHEVVGWGHLLDTLPFQSAVVVYDTGNKEMLKLTCASEGKKIAHFIGLRDVLRQKGALIDAIRSNGK